MSIDVDYSRPKVSHTPQGKLQEVLGCHTVTMRRQHEIDDVAF